MLFEFARHVVAVCIIGHKGRKRGGGGRSRDELRSLVVTGAKRVKGYMEQQACYTVRH